MPAAAASWGTRLVGVMPGRVFTSRHQARPSASRIKSVREYTERPRALCSFKAAWPTRFHSSSVMGAGQISSAPPF